MVYKVNTGSEVHQSWDGCLTWFLACPGKVVLVAGADFMDSWYICRKGNELFELLFTVGVWLDSDSTAGVCLAGFTASGSRDCAAADL